MIVKALKGHENNSGNQKLERKKNVYNDFI